MQEEDCAVIRRREPRQDAFNARCDLPFRPCSARTGRRRVTPSSGRTFIRLEVPRGTRDRQFSVCSKAKRAEIRGATSMSEYDSAFLCSVAARIGVDTTMSTVSCLRDYRRRAYGEETRL